VSEIVDLVGYNALRVVFSIVAFSNCCLLLLVLVQNYGLRILGIAIYILLLWSNVLHFRYFGSTIQLGSLLNFEFLPYLGSQIQLLMQWSDYIYLLTFIVSAVCFSDTGKLSKKNRIPTIILFTTIWLGLQIFQYFAETQSPLNSARKFNEPYTRWDIYKEIRFESRNHSGSILQFGFLWTYAMDFYRLNNYRDSGKIISKENFLIDIPKNSRRNIVVIQVESLDKRVINHAVNGKLVMPFMSRLTKQSFYFSKVFAQHSSAGGTSDAELCLLTSQYPLGFKGAFFANNLEKLPSIPTILNRNDYVTLAFHGNSGAYFNRKQGFLKLGFQKTFFKNDFVINDPDKWHALKDLDFLRQVQQTLTATKSPYFAYILTLTSHTPFDLIAEKDYVSDFQLEDRVVQNYFNSMAYVDKALEEFISTIQKMDPNTLIVLFGDHCANIHEAEYKSYKFKGLEPIPLIIIDQRIENKKDILTAGSTLDIGPTLFDYLGIQDPEFWQGKSLLNENNSENTFIFGSPYYFDNEGKQRKLADHNVDTEALYRIREYVW
jgi:phosphoglycerol transferase MdoB-like AlkP superfamily enzyme